MIQRSEAIQIGVLVVAAMLGAGEARAEGNLFGQGPEARRAPRASRGRAFGYQLRPGDLPRVRNFVRGQRLRASGNAIGMARSVALALAARKQVGGLPLEEQLELFESWTAKESREGSVCRSSQGCEAAIESALRTLQTPERMGDYMVTLSNAGFYRDIGSGAAVPGDLAVNAQARRYLAVTGARRGTTPVNGQAQAVTQLHLFDPHEEVESPGRTPKLVYLHEAGTFAVEASWVEAARTEEEGRLQYRSVSWTAHGATSYRIGETEYLELSPRQVGFLSQVSRKLDEVTLAWAQREAAELRQHHAATRAVRADTWGNKLVDFKNEGLRAWGAVKTLATFDTGEEIDYYEHDTEDRLSNPWPFRRYAQTTYGAWDEVAKGEFELRTSELNP